MNALLGRSFRLLEGKEFGVKCSVWMELRLPEWREFRVKCAVRKELRLIEWKGFMMLEWQDLSLLE